MARYRIIYKRGPNGQYAGSGHFVQKRVLGFWKNLTSNCSKGYAEMFLANLLHHKNDGVKVVGEYSE